MKAMTIILDGAGVTIGGAGIFLVDHAQAVYLVGAAFSFVISGIIKLIDRLKKKDSQDSQNNPNN